VQATAETVQLDARNAYLAYTQAKDELQIARGGSRRVDGVNEAKDFASLMTAKSAIAKAELDLMKAETRGSLGPNQAPGGDRPALKSSGSRREP
jgi:hypothetical protein